LVGFESLNVHLNKGDERTTEIWEGATTAINDRTGSCHDPSMFLHDVNGLEQTSSTSNDILCDQELFSGCDRESTAEYQAARTVLFGEDVPLAKLPGDFLSDDNSSDGRRDYRSRFEGLQLLRKQSAHVSSRASIL
jgi:hypothetical protein